MPHLKRWLWPALALMLVLATARAAAAPAGQVAPAVTGPAMEDRLCVSTTAVAAVQATLPGCQQAFCAAADAAQVCACKRRDGWRFEHRRGGQVLQHWRMQISPLMGASAFGLTLADLDGDGHSEWLVALLQSVSNGLGVSHHALCTLANGQALCRDVAEWGALSVPVAEAGRAGCALMDANWQSGREAGRAQGTYAVGRLLRWQGGRWQPAPASQRPAVARRLLREFEAERGDLPRRNAQRLWYQHPTALTVVCPGPLCPVNGGR